MLIKIKKEKYKIKSHLAIRPEKKPFSFYSFHQRVPFLSFSLPLIKVTGKEKKEEISHFHFIWEFQLCMSSVRIQHIFCYIHIPYSALCTFVEQRSLACIIPYLPSKSFMQHKYVNDMRFFSFFESDSKLICNILFPIFLLEFFVWK